MYGKWEESFMKLDAFREELLIRNEGSIVEIDFDIAGDKKRFKRFFISLAACSEGFLGGCCPYISLDACHLKGKFTGVLVVATDGLVISSDMEKGLEVAAMHISPNAEHRECVRNLYSNFKKQFRDEFFKKLWCAAKTYRPTKHDKLLKDIADIWSRSKFETPSKCDYITNNISESFNSWIGATHYKHVLDLLDAIREKLMKRFDKKRMLLKRWNGVFVPNAMIRLNDISKNLGEYEVCGSGDNQVEVKFNGMRLEVNQDTRKFGCRVWQVTGFPFVHSAAFIAFTRDVIWAQYVDQYFSIQKFKEAYAFKIALMPGKDHWIKKDGEKIYPPLMKRPPGRPKKI
ncbi:hypothetical protein Lser_V15G19860 [Lactuca serriola]